MTLHVPTLKPGVLVCRRVAKATGASIVLSLADAEASETFEASSLGTADQVITHMCLVRCIAWASLNLALL